MSNKIIVIGSIVISCGLILLALASTPSQDVELPVDGSNVSVVEGKQIIEIEARGGYSPRKSIAKSGLPTILRFKTDGVFDCSAAVRIPRLDISRQLVIAGNTDIDIGVQTEGKLRGSCTMGMYPFEIEFQ